MRIDEDSSYFRAHEDTSTHIGGFRASPSHKYQPPKLDKRINFDRTDSPNSFDSAPENEKDQEQHVMS